jgi:hypothetical protein
MVSQIWCVGCILATLVLQDFARYFLYGSVVDKKKYEMFMKVGLSQQ